MNIIRNVFLSKFLILYNIYNVEDGYRTFDFQGPSGWCSFLPELMYQIKEPKNIMNFPKEYKSPTTRNTI